MSKDFVRKWHSRFTHKNPIQSKAVFSRLCWRKKSKCVINKNLLLLSSLLFLCCLSRTLIQVSGKLNLVLSLSSPQSVYSRSGMSFLACWRCNTSLLNNPGTHLFLLCSCIKVLRPFLQTGILLCLIYHPVTFKVRKQNLGEGGTVDSQQEGCKFDSRPGVGGAFLCGVYIGWLLLWDLDVFQSAPWWPKNRLRTHCWKETLLFTNTETQGTTEHAPKLSSWHFLAT